MEVITGCNLKISKRVFALRTPVQKWWRQSYMIPEVGDSPSANALHAELEW